MTRSKTNPQVDAFLKKEKQWPEEVKELRKILLDCGLTEELKWGKPCYQLGNSNLVVVQPFKQYCALLFFKGGLLSNAHGFLVKTGENTEAGRQLRFANVGEIRGREAIVRASIAEAIAVEKAGLKVETKKVSELKIPEELQKKWREKPAFKKAFDALTPGRQRAYIFHISGAKQSKTREARVEKWMPHILKGKGMDDE